MTTPRPRIPCDNEECLPWSQQWSVRPPSNPVRIASSANHGLWLVLIKSCNPWITPSVIKIWNASFAMASWNVPLVSVFA
ncbi:hypothetical protein SeLEV6574_g05879 [Synchytrium endobioticum]|uniref:Uncharacterized protein n=1 Tax=Synchytrium endobioticum TaxID=286115 RepID=A0A507CRV5_9FUNG|nr:hypothetical protein SeLEV6574_g05879 [Synchytrium endobioticum]